jgi:hypothetical protein
VIDIHTTALRRKLGSSPLPRARAYQQEARLVVLELMGYLVNYYRRRALSSGPTFGAGAQTPQDDGARR